ncbi:MAG: AEC family transporter [Caldilineaceae bacterium]
MLRDLARNPLLIGVVLGLGVNVLGIVSIPVLHDLAGVLGDAALPIMLLCVGANIRVRHGRGACGNRPVHGGQDGRLPTTVFFVGQLTGLAGLPLQVALLFGGAYGSVSLHAGASQLGGDARSWRPSSRCRPLTPQFFTLPLTVALTNSLIG